MVYPPAPAGTTTCDGGVAIVFEVRLADYGDRDTDAIVGQTLRVVKDSKRAFRFERTPRIVLTRLQRLLPTLQNALDEAETEAHLNLITS